MQSRTGTEVEAGKGPGLKKALCATVSVRLRRGGSDAAMRRSPVPRHVECGLTDTASGPSRVVLGVQVVEGITEGHRPSLVDHPAVEIFATDSTDTTRP